MLRIFVLLAVLVPLLFVVSEAAAHGGRKKSDIYRDRHYNRQYDRRDDSHDSSDSEEIVQDFGTTTPMPTTTTTMPTTTPRMTTTTTKAGQTFPRVTETTTTVITTTASAGVLCPDHTPPCPANESYNCCAPCPGERVCGVYVPIPCYTECTPKCVCDPEYNRDTNGTCVLPKDCSTLRFIA
ncbi:putative TIL domain protein [Anopheles sinensis]|uniref:Putative TIL domain protein n=1 Tax=Anopheles sinensis TaxID=74873 RepID=A0A084WQ50_ANOSI|nr:putative TIL domain protein [Anopheles sinensis]